MEQPIKYSDLISPDESIETLIKQLDEANEAYNNLGNSVKAEAARIASAMQTISGATQQGRSATRGYSEDTEKLLKAQRDLNFARSETARKIAELKQLQKDEQTITKLTIQLNRASAGSYEALSAQYSLNKIRLNAMTEEYRKNTAEGQKLEKETRDIYERMSELQKATGKYTLEVGNYEKAVGQLMGVQGKWLTNLEQLNQFFGGGAGIKAGIQAAGDAVSAFGKRLLALLANPIVAVIAAIAAAFMALKQAISSSEENTRTLTRVLAPFQRIVTAIVDVMQTFAGWLLKAVEGMENMAMAASRWAEKLPVLGKYLRQVNNELESNIRLEKEKQSITDANRKLTVKEAKTEYEIAVLRRKAAQTNNPKEQAALLSKAIAKEKQLSDERVSLLTRELNVMKVKAKQSQNDAAFNEAIAQKEAEIWRVRAQREQASLRMVSKLRKAQDKMNKPETVKDNSAEEERRQQQLLALIGKNENLRISLYEDSFSREYALIVNNYEQQEATLVRQGEKDVTLRAAINEQIELLEKKKYMDLAALTAKYMEEETKRLQQQEEKSRKAAEDVRRQQISAIDQQNQLEQLQIDNMDTSENKKTELKLEAEKKRIKAIYDLNVKAGKDLNSLEMQILREQMANIDRQIEGNKKDRDIFDIFGIDVSDEKKEAISTAYSFAIDQLNEYMNALVEAANRKVEMADKDVENAQRTLDAEREARNAGYANNVEMAQKELENAKKNQEKALKEQEKAQKQQQAIQALQQIGNLITSTSLIWSQLGFPWAIPAIAVMWGSFAYAKIKAAQMVGTESYGEGTVELLDGGSHQSGNDVDLGRKKDGTRRRAEGGEFFAVINKRNSRKYRKEIPDVIHALNSGTFEQKYMNAYKGSDSVIINDSQSPDLRMLSDDVAAIREQGERKTYTDADGVHVIYKNLHRVIKN